MTMICLLQVGTDMPNMH